MDVEPGGDGAGDSAGAGGRWSSCALAIDAVVEHLLDEAGSERGGALVDGLEHVAGADAGLLAGRVGGDLAGAKAAGVFHPPDAVGRDVVVGLGREVQPGENADRHGDGGQHDGKNSRLECVLHLLRHFNQGT